MQEGVYQKPVRNVDELKQRLIAAWSGIQQSIIDQAIDQWWERLNACVKATGKHVKQIIILMCLSRTVNISVRLLLALLWLWTDWHMVCFTR